MSSTAGSVINPSHLSFKYVCSSGQIFHNPYRVLSTIPFLLRELRYLALQTLPYSSYTVHIYFISIHIFQGHDNHGLRSERVIHVKELIAKVDDLNPVVWNVLFDNHRCVRDAMEWESLPRLVESYYLLISHENSISGEESSLCWHNPRLIMTPLNDHCYPAKDLCRGPIEEARTSRLHFYFN